MVMPPVDTTTACQLLQEVEDVRKHVLKTGQALYEQWKPTITRELFHYSAQNLAYYLALRQLDLRDLQARLMPWGLSSLGRTESRVIETLDTLVATLHTLCHLEPRETPVAEAFMRGTNLLESKAEQVFGQPSSHRRVRIMVTFPTTAATDYPLVRDLLRRGMNCARINCAHDDPATWQSMIDNIRAAEEETGKRCRILMDLGGPKIRTFQSSFPKKHRFQKGDVFLLASGDVTAADPYPQQVNCTLPDVLAQVHVGHSIWFDDGKIGTRVEEIVPGGLVLRITNISSEGERIRPEKGINFPDTLLDVSPLTAQDLQDLDFVAQHADMVGYSFVQNGSDIERLRTELKDRLPDPADHNRIAIVAKIETQAAVQNLPDMIVRAGGKQPFAIMIARGDLAVEIGFERLAEIQEEILWICEAAHVPVIWATQVMENFVKSGVPTRAEVTDAAMAERAECVMLNKGAHILEGVSLVDNVLVRMESHQFKKTPGLRALRSWKDVLP